MLARQISTDYMMAQLQQRWMPRLFRNIIIQEFKETEGITTLRDTKEVRSLINFALRDAISV